MSLPLRERCREQRVQIEHLIATRAIDTHITDAYALRDLLRACDRRLRQLDARHQRDRRTLDWFGDQFDQADAAIGREVRRCGRLRCLGDVLDLLATGACVTHADVDEDDDCEWLGVRG